MLEVRFGNLLDPTRTYIMLLTRQYLNTFICTYTYARTYHIYTGLIYTIIEPLFHLVYSERKR